MDESQIKLLWSNPTNLIYNRKLDSALRNGNCEKFLSKIKLNVPLPWQDQVFWDTCKEKFKVDNNTFFRMKTNIFPSILMRVLQRSYFRHKHNWIHKGMKLSRANMDIQFNYLISQCDPEIKKVVLNAHSAWMDNLIPSTLVNLSSVLPLFDDAVSQMGRSNPPRTLSDRTNAIEHIKTFNYWTVADLQLHVVWSNTLCMISYDHIFYLFPSSYFLLLHNKLFDIFSVLSLAHFSSGTIYESECYSSTLDFILSLCRLSLKWNDKFFHIVKVLEGLVTAITLTEVDGPTNREFLDNLTIGLLEDHRINITNTAMYTVLLNVSIPLRHELGCLNKILGHPFVDMEAGVTKLYKNMTTPQLAIPSLVQQTLRHCKKRFIKSYILRHHRWPVVLLAPCSHKGLSRAMFMNKDPDSNYITSRYGTVPVEAYDAVELAKILEFDNIENFIPYLKDKTISIARSRVLNTYLSSNPEKITWVETRVLLYYLLNTDKVTDHVSYLERYKKSETLKDLLDYLVIRIVPKEKELKEAFRGFGCKTYMDRARSIIQEKNVKHFLDLYSNEQAMTLSELDILHRLNSFRQIHKAWPGYTPLYIVVDASSWNNHFRRETVDVVMKEYLDKLYGTPIFSKTMLAFNQSLIYVPDTQGVWSWEGQAGGIEGLNQDSWVSLYIAQIHVAMEDYEYPYQIFCKGDDMRVVVLVPPTVLARSNLLEVKNSIVTSIQNTLQQLGHKINIEESYGSTSYFAFSKNASCGMIELPQGYRKIQKTYGANNAFLPLLDDYIGSAFSNAHSTAKVMPSCYPTYSVALLWSYYHLLRHPKYRTLTNVELESILLVPSVVGGFPVIYLHNMFVRAESDLLSPFIGIIKYTYDHYPEHHTCLSRYLKQEYLPYDKAFPGLLSDPYSLPIKKPNTPTSVLRMEISPAIRERCKNKQVKNLFKLIDKGVSDIIIKLLQESNVYNAKVFAAAYAASPAGILSELTRKFESGRSILELLVIRGGYRLGNRVLRRVLSADNKVHRHRLTVIKGKNRWTEDVNFLIEDIDCPAQAAQLIRDHLWKHHVESITMPPLQHQIYVSRARYTMLDGWEDENHFEYVLHHPTSFLPGQKLPLFSSSLKKPFIGYTTRNSMVPPRIQFIEKDLLLSKVKDLIDLVSWTNYEARGYDGQVYKSNFPVLVRYLLSLYLDVPPEQIMVFRATKKSGTISHHLRSPNFRESIVPNTLSNIYQRVTSDSNTHISLRNQGLHLQLNFLHVMCFVINIITTAEQLGCNMIASSATFWGITTPCQHCNSAIIESPIVLSNLESLPDIEQYRVTTISHQALRIVNDSLEKSRRLQVDPEPLDVTLTIEQAASGIIQEFIYTTYVKRLKMIENFTSHNPSQEGYSVLQGLTNIGHSRYVGMTEMARVPTASLAISISLCITDYFLEQQGSIDDKKVTMYLLTHRSLDLPWFFLIEKLHDSGRLGHLLSYLSAETNTSSPADATDVHQAARYVGQAGVLLCMTDKIMNPSLVHLSIYEISNLNTMIISRIRSLHIYLLKYVRSLGLRDSISDGWTVLQAYEYFILFGCLKAFHDPDHGIEDTSSYGVYTYQVIKTTQFLEDRELYINFPSYNEFGEIIADPEDTYMRCVEALDTVPHIASNLEIRSTLSIVYTDIETCISKIRGLDAEPLWNLDRPERKMVHDIQIHRIQPLHGHMTVLHSGHRSIPTRKEEEDIYPTIQPPESYIVRQSSYRRFIWAGSTASMKIIEILNSLSLHTLPDNHVYVCMAEGNGGFAGVISSRTTQSNIIFNTLRPPNQPQISPVECQQLCLQYSNYLDYQLVNTGYDNMASQDTLNAYLKQPIVTPLITCDANFTDEWYDVVRNVITYFFQKRTLSGCLILKIFLDKPTFVNEILCVLSQTCLHTNLFKPASSHPNQESYIISYGTKNPAILYYAFSGYLPINLHRNLNHHIREIQRSITETYLEKPRYIKVILPDRSSFRNAGHLGSTILHVLNSRFSATYTYGQLHRYMTTGKDNFKSFLSQVVIDHINQGKNQLRKRTRDEMADVVWDTDTRSRKTKVAELMLLCYGVLDGLYLWDEVLSNQTTEISIRQSYIKHIQRFPPRLQWHPVTSAHYKGPLKDGTFQSEPYLNYITGIELSLLCYVDYYANHHYTH